MVLCHPDQPMISVWATYSILESHDVSGGSLVVLACAYNDVKYSPCPFPCTVAVAIANDSERDMHAMALSDLTAWPLLSGNDGKVIYPKELAH